MEVYSIDESFLDAAPVEPERRVDWGKDLRSTVSTWTGVPFNSFSELNKDAGGDIWFAFGEEQPTAMFAGIWCRQWTSVRKIKNGVEIIDVFGFLKTKPNAEAEAVHPKAMPVDDAGRMRDVDDGAIRAGEGASASAGRWIA